jgi:hypothetical protein
MKKTLTAAALIATTILAPMASASAHPVRHHGFRPQHFEWSHSTSISTKVGTTSCARFDPTTGYFSNCYSIGTGR